MPSHALAPSALEQLLARLGPAKVDPSPVAREAYARDLSTLGHLGFASGSQAGTGFRPPDAVVRAASVEDVRAVLELARDHGFAVVPWGAGSGVCGGSVAHLGGVVLDLKGLDRILEVDHESQLVRVEAGVNGQVLEDALQARGLTAGHFPSSITCSTVGGWIAARGAGQLSTRYGKVEDMVVGLEVVLADGTLVRTPIAPRAATGPDWNQLFVGCEGTLGVVVAATLRVHRLPARRLFRSWELPDLPAAIRAIREALQRGARPAAVRLYDPLDTLLVARAGDAPPLPPPGAEAPPPDEDELPLPGVWPLSAFGPRRLAGLLQGALPQLKERLERTALAHPELLNRLTGSIPGVGWLLLFTCEGDPELAAAEARITDDACRAAGGTARGPGPAETWWRNRLAVSFKQSAVYAKGGFVDTMEVATTWRDLPRLHERVRAALAPHGLVMAHFSHAYLDGCSIYFTFAALQGDPATTLERYRAAWRDALGAAVEVGAAISHHHGVGLLKAEALVASHGSLHGVFRAVKQALDPGNVLNPGKLGLPA